VVRFALLMTRAPAGTDTEITRGHPAPARVTFVQPEALSTAATRPPLPRQASAPTQVAFDPQGGTHTTESAPLGSQRQPGSQSSQRALFRAVLALKHRPSTQEHGPVTSLPHGLAGLHCWHCDNALPFHTLVFLEPFEPFMQRQNRRQQADVREGLGEVAQ
jgi:hypothetical protein